MAQLGNSHRGLPPSALRSLLTGAIRPTFLWDSELWNTRDRPVNLGGMRRLEYQALRKISGAYHGASHEKLGFITAVEPLQCRLDHISILWAARSLRTGDPHIRDILDTNPAPNHTLWHDSTGNPNLDGPISGVFYLTPILTQDERSYGDCQDITTTPTALLHLTMLDPSDGRSKDKGYWAGTIWARMEEGWRFCYTDGTGLGGQAASGVYSENHLVNPPDTHGGFLGDLASVADAERHAVSLALKREDADMLYKVLIDSQTALRNALNISRGAPPCSHLDTTLKRALIQRRDKDTAIPWIRSHIGIKGNTAADKQAAFESCLGVTAGTPKSATWEGINAQ